MSAFPVLEVAIGLSFTYLLLALVTTTITEWISRIRNARGQVLVQGISQLVGEPEDGPVTTAILDHPLIKPLGQPKGDRKQRVPSYIPAPLFSRALADITSPERQARIAEEKSTPKVTTQLQDALQALRTGPELRTRENVTVDPVAEWYEAHMERVSGWYKRHTQTVVLLLSIAITLFTNANTVGLAQRLWTDAPLREAVIESAKTRLQQGPPIQAVEYEDPLTPKPTKPLATENDNSNRVLPEEQELLENMLGWSGERARYESNRGWWIASHMLGWLISAFAISLGAPFWFDTLNKLMNIRSAGRSPKEAAAGK
jgi:hypothetical protein